MPSVLHALCDEFSIIKIYVNEEPVVVFTPFYFCNKNVILFSHN